MGYDYEDGGDATEALERELVGDGMYDLGGTGFNPFHASSVFSAHAY
jgi:hypothetical protein